MRILIISYYFPPVKSVASARIRGFAVHLQELGHEVEVLTAGAPSCEPPVDGIAVHRVQPGSLDFLESKLAFLRSENLAAARARAPQKKPGMLERLNRFRIRRGLGYLGRMPDLTDLWYLSAKSWLKQSGKVWDCVICSYAPYSSVLLGMYARQHGHCRMLVTDFRDLWSRHHLFRGLFPFTVIERRLERKVLAASDLVTTVSEELRQEIEKLAGDANVLVISNGFEPAAGGGVAGDGDGSVIRLVYTGTVYPEFQDIHPLLNALSQLERDCDEGARPVSLVLAGGGGDKIVDIAAQQGATDQVAYSGNLDYADAIALQQCADFLLYIDFSGLDYDGVIPTKLFEYAGGALPVLFLHDSGKSSAARFMEQCGTAIFVPNDAGAIVEFFRRYRRDKSLAGIEPDEAFIAQYTRQNQTRILEQAMSREFGMLED